MDSGWNRIPRSPLAGFRPVAGPILLSELTEFGCLNLRGEGPGFMAASSAALGFELSDAPNTTSRDGKTLALWLGPDEWAIRAPLHRTPALEDALDRALDACHCSVNDVSDQFALMRLSGLHAREVLERGCPLDLHEREFAPGRCARSHFLEAGVLIYQADSVPGFDIWVRRSHGPYLWHMLESAIASVKGLIA